MNKQHLPLFPVSSSPLSHLLVAPTSPHPPQISRFPAPRSPSPQARTFVPGRKALRTSATSFLSPLSLSGCIYVPPSNNSHSCIFHLRPSKVQRRSLTHGFRLSVLPNPPLATLSLGAFHWYLRGYHELRFFSVAVYHVWLVRMSVPFTYISPRRKNGRRLQP